MKTMKQWQEDPIVEEVRRVRAKLSKELEKDPQAFYARIKDRALKAGMQVSDLKPISLKELRERKNKAGSRKK